MAKIMKVALILFYTQDIVCMVFNNILGYLLLTSHSINRDNAICQIKSFDKFRNSRYFIGFIMDFYLPRTDSIITCLSVAM